MLLRLMSLHTDNDRGRWKKRDPRREPPPPLTTEYTSSNVLVGKLTLRDALFDADDDVSSDILNAL